jgi:hypothetical protein
MVPGNPLEHALVAAAAEASARPLFYRLLLESPLHVTSALKSSARPDDIVDFVRMADSSVAQYMRRTSPFYRKKLLGIF